jgi:hypothetical protein
MDFGQHCGVGYGADWRGVIFRQSYPELSDLVAKSQAWFPLIWPNNAVFNETAMRWRWKTGEELKFAHFRNASDYSSYHGKEFGFIGWEELTNWPSDDGYKVMMTCCRSARHGMPRKYRATTNPAGPGTNWIKRRFQLPVPDGQILGPVIEAKEIEGLPNTDKRCAINCMFSENLVLKSSEPNYLSRIAEGASPAQRDAWIRGSWDITSGGMIDDIWERNTHVVPDIYANQLPRGWKAVRAFDWGMSKPFSFGIWVESDGTPIKIGNRVLGSVKGDVFRMFEWYGAIPNEDNKGLRLTATEIAEGILERENLVWGMQGRIRGGSCDDACFEDYQPGQTVAGDMAKKGVRWTPAGKGPGSRIQGWHTLRTYLQNALPRKDGPREKPGMFVCERCVEWIRLVPIIPRDKKNQDDVDTESEDHAADETRYYLRRKLHEGKTIQWH